MNKHVFRMFFAAILIFISTTCFSQLSKQQAIDKVLNEIVVSDTGRINVWTLQDIKNYHDTIKLKFDTSLLCPYSYNWVFFVDDSPFANWTHPCRYIFIDSVSASFQIIDQNQYPICLEIPCANDFEIISEVDYPLPDSLPENENPRSPTTNINDNLYAVIIVTEDAAEYDKGNKHPNRFWYDASLIYNTLIQVYGYKDENIFVHYYDGTSPRNGNDFDGDEGQTINHIDYNAEKASILNTFSNMAGNNTIEEIPTLTEDDQLFVFIDGHGTESFGKSVLKCKYPGPLYENLYDYELATAVENINCAQMVFLIQPCNSGNFAYELTNYNPNYYDVKCKNRVVHTSTTIDYQSTSEVYITGGYYTEFTYYWAAAVRGNYPETKEPWKQSYEVGTMEFNDFDFPLYHHNDYNPDEPGYGNDDGFVQMEEAFSYADDMDSWSPNGYHVPYPTACNECYEEPVNIDKIGYDENEIKYNNLLTLFGLAGGGEDDNTLISNRNYMVGETITVEDGTGLFLEESSTLYTTGNNSQFVVRPDGQLQFYNNTTIYSNGMSVEGDLRIEDNVTLFNSGIYVNGDIDVGANTSFNDLSLELDNINLQTTFNTSIFNNCSFSSIAKELNISFTEFNNCGIVYSFAGDVNVINSNFTNTWLLLEDQKNNPASKATVKNSDFETNIALVAIDLNNYANFSIDSNTIAGYYNGLQLFYSGLGQSGNQTIYNNTISNSTVSGIHLFNSTADISSNYIYDNQYGIKIYDNCNISLQGNPNSQTYDEINYITNNNSYELYASVGSFPWYFRYNAIIDEDNLGNPTDPMVYYDAPTGGFPLMDVKYNCWGNNFNQLADLYPTGYMISPVWCPSGGGHKSSEIALQTYLDGLDRYGNEDYTDAKSTFESIVEEYPNTIYASAAMKELFGLEKFVDNDYYTLKQYYLTNDSIQADSVLVKLAVFLSNKCEIEMQNWQTAINHFEDIIENPDSPQDSIFAIIDLGYTYFLMENSGQKSTAQGRLLQYKPESKTEFSAKRDTLLALLPFKTKPQETETEFDLQTTGKLSQNIPNPFSGTTIVFFNLDKSADVIIKVADHLGKTVKQFNFSSQQAGENKVELYLNGLSSGIYFYSLFVNGQLSDTKKMVVK